MPHYRAGTPTDSRAVFDVFAAAIADLSRRQNLPGDEWSDPQFIASFWERRRALFDHLARSAEHFWVAEDQGQVIGYARSTLNAGVRELTEFFVRPGFQSEGLGRELLRRAFPAEGARRLVIIATTDVRAQGRYLKTGVLPRFPIQYWSRQPQRAPLPTDLELRRAANTPETLAALREIDRAVLDMERDDDHRFLLGDRQGMLYFRGERAVGYGYQGKGTGPIALLDPADFPAVLAQAETAAAERGESHFGLEVPMINRAAVQHLLKRGFRLDPFLALMMCDEPFGRLENYIASSPPFFM